MFTEVLFSKQNSGRKENQKIMPKGVHMDMSKNSYKQRKISLKQGKTYLPTRMLSGNLLSRVWMHSCEENNNRTSD